MSTQDLRSTKDNQTQTIAQSPSKEPANETGSLSAAGSRQAMERKDNPRKGMDGDEPNEALNTNTEPQSGVHALSQRERLRAAEQSLRGPVRSVDVRNADASDSTLDADAKMQDALRDATPLQNNNAVFTNASPSAGEASPDGFPAGIDSRMPPSPHTPSPAEKDAQLRRKGISVSPL